MEKYELAQLMDEENDSSVEDDDINLN